LQRRQHQPAHRRLDRRRLPQPDGADCAIGAQQHGEVSGRAELVSAAVVAEVTLELHQYQARRQQRRNLCRLHQPRLDLWQLAVERLLQLLLAGQQRLAALDVLQQALAIQPRQQRQFRARFTLLRLQEGNLPAITEHRHQIKPPAFRQQRQLALQIGHFCAHRFSQQRQGGAGVGQLQLLAGQVVGGDGQIFRVGQVGLRQLAIDLYRFLCGGQPFLTAD